VKSHFFCEPASASAKYSYQLLIICFAKKKTEQMIYTISIMYFQTTNNLSVEDFHNPNQLPVIQTVDVQRFIDSFNSWLHPENRQPFILVGPEGCGKG